MKTLAHTIIIIIVTLIFLPARADYRLTLDNNLPRDNDVLQYAILPYSEVLYSKNKGDTIGTWDFSSATPQEQDHKIRYRFLNDTLLVKSYNKEQLFYTLDGFSLYHTQSRNPGKRVSFSRPEPILSFPFGVGNIVEGYSYGQGVVDGNRYMHLAGFTSIKADALGTIITPDNDTIDQCLMMHYYNIASSDIRTKPTMNSKQNVSMDTICHLIDNDSITHCIEGFSWFALGYRYPVVQLQKITTFNHNIAVDSINVAKYLSLSSQRQDLAYDMQNAAIRDSINSINTVRDSNGQLITELTIKNCTISPLIVENSTYVRLFGYDINQPIEISLYNSLGTKISQSSNSGMAFVNIPMNGLPRGVYIAVVKISGEVHNFKLFKS